VEQRALKARRPVVARDDPQAAVFIARYTSRIASQLQAARAHLRALVPNGFELVYDNYSALAIGFGPTDRASDVVVSIAGYPKWVTLFFLQGVTLPDPACVLKGSGSRVRNVRLDPPEVLPSPPVQALLREAIGRQAPAFHMAPPLRTVVKSVSARQRSRRPAGE
jgi:hypothetical protein